MQILQNNRTWVEGSLNTPHSFNIKKKSRTILLGVNNSFPMSAETVFLTLFLSHLPTRNSQYLFNYFSVTTDA